MVHSYLKMEAAPTQKCKMPNYFNKDSSRQRVLRVNYGVQERKKSAEVCLVFDAQQMARHLWAGALGPGTFYFRSHTYRDIFLLLRTHCSFFLQ